MADAAVEAGVLFILENVKELLLYNAELISTSKAEVEGLKRDLGELQGFVEDSVGNREINHEQQALLNSIISIVYKAEDAVEIFVVEKAKHIERGAANRFFHVVDHESKVRNIAVEVKEIRRAVEQINARRTGERPQTPRLHDNSATTRKVPKVEEHDVVGFDKETDMVIKFLMGDSLERDVFGIVGMAGLGKTTLANKVFKDERIDYKFVHRAWVYVSKYNRVEDVFISVLKDLTDIDDASLNSMDSEKLAQEIKKCLKDKKYLVVLDDVSLSTPTWDELEVAFPRNSKGSRILLTTRLKGVAEHANDQKKSHNLKFLTETESLELLNKKIFGKGDCSSDLFTQAQLVANKCGGLPLAIVVIAGIISPQREVKEWWDQVAQRVNELVNVHDRSNFNEVVSWSFKSLPYNKKLCFLYLGIFPRGPIAVRDLTRLWIAEGFIPNESRLGFENEAVEWLYDLVDRNLVMAHSWGSNGRIKTCRVHDALRDYCKLEAEKQKLYHEIDWSTPFSPSNYRRICIHKQVTEYISSKKPDIQVRTFITFPERKIILEPAVLITMLKAFKRIRVLEVSSLKFTRLPKQIQEFALLRYLAFSCDFNSIPSSISSLWSLQTLIILTSESVLRLPEEIWKLYQLRHLQTTASALLLNPPNSIKERGSGDMQTLSSIGPESCTEEVISRILYVKKLGVRGKLAKLLENGSKLIKNLGMLQDLTNLKLFNDATSESLIRNLSPKFPKKLTKLTLSNTFIDWEHMPILGELDSLVVLKLKDNAFRGEVWKMKAGSFPSLRFLYIDRTDLRIWEAGDQQFNSLIRLVLQNCEELGAVPSCLIDVQSFTTLDIYRCSKAVTSARKLHQKKSLQEGQSNRSSGGFKLTVYPPDM